MRFYMQKYHFYSNGMNIVHPMSELYWSVCAENVWPALGMNIVQKFKSQQTHNSSLLIYQR